MKGAEVKWRGRQAVDRQTDAEGWDLIRKAIQSPNEEAYLSADRLHREVRRLQTQLARVRSRGGSYRQVDVSNNVRELLARLEAGATLSTYVH